MQPAILQRKRTHFVLWRPGPPDPPPKLVIGTFRAGKPPTLDAGKTIPLRQSATSPDLWEVAASECGLKDGHVYHYWFEVKESSPYGNRPAVRCTDPAAYAVDWRLGGNPAGAGDDPNPDEAAAAVVLFRGGQLLPTDPESLPATFDRRADVPMSKLPANNRLVIYELPTAWTKTGDLVDDTNVGVGTFRDVLALVEREECGAHFAGVARVREHRHLVELGVNALELLPPADTFLSRRSWGYATSNYFAPDFDLGRPLDPASGADANDAKASTAVTDFLRLVRACHENGIRFIYDAVMAFGRHDPYRLAAFLDFHVQFGTGDPEQGSRDGFGGDLWKYAYPTDSYDPLTGNRAPLYRARRHMIAHLVHWMHLYHVDGLRLDSVNNFNNWDFAGDVRREARAAWNERWTLEGNAAAGADERFLVIGEELSVPKGLLGRLDALWNEDFKHILRKVILGRSADNEPSFEWSVRKLIDCRLLGFADGAQAVNYVGTHDVGGPGNERLYNYLHFNGVTFKDKPIKLAFACLLTAVGIPMILAGDEFADEHDVDIFNVDQQGRKELDPVNFDRLDQDPWRRELFQYVARLVKFRTQSTALSVNDTQFIHADFNDGKRVLAWQRGRPGVDDPVVVVANFSDYGTPNPVSPGAQYVVPNFPAPAAGKRWREITTARDVPAAQAGREPIFPWEAKVYAVVA